MKKISIFLSFLFLILIFNNLTVHSLDNRNLNHSTNEASSGYILTINNGSLGGLYEESTEVHIFADPKFPLGLIFDKWVGNIETIKDINSSHTTLTMPNSNISINATYKQMPVFDMKKEWFEGILFYHCIPENCKGLIFLFHGGGEKFWFTHDGGKAKLWPELHVEKKIFCIDAVSREYGVIALQSHRKLFRREYSLYLPTVINPDIKNVKKLINEFKSRNLIDDSTAIYGLGFSFGGAFSPKVAFACDFNATAIYCMGHKEFPILNPNYDIPTIWFLGEDDFYKNVNNRAKFYYTILKNRGIDAELYENSKSPIYPDRFLRINVINPEFTKEDSENIFNSLKAEGYIDKNHYLTMNPFISTEWIDSIPSEYIAYVDGGISRELYHACAGHNFFNEYNQVLFDFFEKY